MGPICREAQLLGFELMHPKLPYFKACFGFDTLPLAPLAKRKLSSTRWLFRERSMLWRPAVKKNSIPSKYKPRKYSKYLHALRQLKPKGRRVKVTVNAGKSVRFATELTVYI